MEGLCTCFLAADLGLFHVSKFAVGWWFFIDAVVYAATMENPPVTIKLEDWISGIFSTLGMIMYVISSCHFLFGTAIIYCIHSNLRNNILFT